ncbi:MAG: FeoA family protein [Thermoguttaceae bacterium]|nr:FeoA family protein [Thermoguttaceae bacterium]
MTAPSSSHTETQSKTADAPPKVYLADLPVGARATILSLKLASNTIGQFMGMGLFPGSCVEVLQKGFSRKKPILLGVDDTRIAMGWEYAECIVVEPNESVKKTP